MPSIDTNLLLRLVLGDIPEQRDVTLQFLKRKGAVAVADLAITETVFVLERSLGIPRSKIVKLLQALSANQYLDYNRDLFDRVLRPYAEHPKVSFNDCCLAVHAKLNGQTPLYTFDKKLARQLPHTELL